MVRAHVCIAALPAATVLPLAEWDLRARCVSDDVAGFSHLLICTSLGALLTCDAGLPSIRESTGTSTVATKVCPSPAIGGTATMVPSGSVKSVKASPSLSAGAYTLCMQTMPCCRLAFIYVSLSLSLSLCEGGDTAPWTAYFQKLSSLYFALFVRRS